MSSVTARWAPNSCQLQFSFKFQKSPASALFIRNRIGRFDRCRFRVVCLANNGVEKDGVRLKRSQSNGSPSAEGLSDWFGSSDKSNDSQQKNGLTGILGAGLAGVLLFAGLTFAALSINTRSASSPKQVKESLTQDEEVLLTSKDEACRVEENDNEAQNIVQDERNLQNDDHKGSRDEGSYIESINSIDENGLADANVGLSADHYGKISIAFDTPFVQEDLQEDSGFTSDVAPDANPSLSESVSEVVGSISLHDNVLKSDNIAAAAGTPEENLGTVELVDTSTTLSSSDMNMLGLSDQQRLLGSNGKDTYSVLLESSLNGDPLAQAPASSVGSQPYYLSESQMPKYEEESVSSQNEEDVKASLASEASSRGNSPSIVVSNAEETFPSQIMAHSSADWSDIPGQDDAKDGRPGPESQIPRILFSPAGIPAPSLISSASRASPGKVLVPPVVDQAQAQALAALQVLKVIEADAQPSELCTRREYARWLVSASSVIARNSISKVYPAMYIENITNLAFDDITPEDPDFSSIQGLAEAGLIVSKLSKCDVFSSPDEDMGSFAFFPDSPLSRQDLVSWKIALEKKLLPATERKILHQLSGFIDIDRIDSDALPALVADLSEGDHGIIALAFGYTRLFQPEKPVTKGQAAVALAAGDAADIVSEELARIEAESMAEKAVADPSSLIAEVEKDINANFEKELLIEREKIDALEKMAEEAKKELERLRAEREQENVVLTKERAALQSEMVVLSKLRQQVEEQLESLMSKKFVVSYEKERVEKLRKATEEENQAIVRLQFDLEVERKALSMARAWAEDEAKRVREQAKVLEEARDRWEKRGIKVVVDDDLREQASEGARNVETQFSVEETDDRADNLVAKLRGMADKVTGKSKAIITMIIEKIHYVISLLKVWTYAAGRQTMEFKEAAVAKAGESLHELRQSTTGFTIAVKEGARRVTGDCREGVEKLTQKFKT